MVEEGQRVNVYQSPTVREQVTGNKEVSVTLLWNKGMLRPFHLMKQMLSESLQTSYHFSGKNATKLPKLWLKRCR